MNATNPTEARRRRGMFAARACRILLLPLLISLACAERAWSASPVVADAARDEAFRVLVFSRTLGYRHASITNGIVAMRELGRENGFAVEATEDPRIFTPGELARFRVVVFLSATGDVLDAAQEVALQRFVESGGGFAGIHGALFGPQACEDHWGWYGELFGCAFTNHSAVLPATVHVEDLTHAANAGLPSVWKRSEEWYNYSGTPRGRARILARVDESTYVGGTVGADHPVVWCRQVGRGRMWYTAMGHTESSFAEPLFRRHLLGGILLAAGRFPAAEFTPNPRVAQSGGEFRWLATAQSLALQRGDQVVWRCNHGTNVAKPYFHPLAIPGGPNLTWDQPPDHVWHHALWFSWKFINGVNYWETEGLPLAERGITTWREPRVDLRPDFSARIETELAYRPPGGEPVLTEHRVVEVSPPDPQQTYHLDWSMTFTALGADALLDRTPLPHEPGGKEYGGYAGLSVRLAKDLSDPRAANSNGPILFANGRHRGRAAAMDYSGRLGDAEAGVAILSDPTNRNSPTPWYTIQDATMRYFSPAVIQDAPMRLKAGESFTLRYRVIVHPGRWDAKQLQPAMNSFTGAASTQ